MDEIADLIRLLAEAPAEEPALSRPKELLDRIAIERAAQEGVVPAGPAVPDAKPKPKLQDSIQPSQPTLAGTVPGRSAEPHVTSQTVGATANPKTGIPEARLAVQLNPPEVLSGRPANPRLAELVAGMPAEVSPGQASAGVAATAQPSTPSPGRPAHPVLAEQDTGRTIMPNQRDPVAGVLAQFKANTPEAKPFVKVMAPETFNGRMATPRLLEAIAGMPAEIRDRQTNIAVAQVTPKARVTVVVPPAFPWDPKEAFSAVDEQLQLPPRQSSPELRDLRVSPVAEALESTEAFVARSYQQLEGNRSETERWLL